MAAPDLGAPLRPLEFDDLLSRLPDLAEMPYTLSWSAFDPPIDSSELGPEHWIRLAREIASLRAECDGFVVLHGSDTMAYTASALSFMLLGLDLPVILTGSQLPIGVMRSDARENLLSSIEIAAAQMPDGRARVPEVCIYFEYALMRGNRCYKHNAENFDAFASPNWPILAEAGVHLRFHESSILPAGARPFELSDRLDTSVGVLYLFPGISIESLSHRLSDPKIKSWVLLTFGNGNAFTDRRFVDILRGALDAGKALFNVSQCRAGSVLQGRYDTSKALAEMNIASGRDITLEAALTKLMYLGAKNLKGRELMRAFEQPLCGEMSDS